MFALPFHPLFLFFDKFSFFKKYLRFDYPNLNNCVPNLNNCEKKMVDLAT